MKRKDLLLLTLLLSQTTMLWAMNTDELPNSSAYSTARSTLDSSEPFVDQDLEYRIQQAEENSKNLLIYKNFQKVMFVGKTGHGKSTSFNIMAGKPFTANKGKLDTLDPISGSEIGHSNASSTTFPSGYKSSDDIVYLDFPGLGDTAGPEQDIVNAIGFHQAFSGPGPTKILGIISQTALAGRGSEFLEIINHLTNTLPLDQLKDGLALIITKQGYVRDLDVPETIKEMLEKKADNSVHLMTENVRALLSHLTAPENIEKRISYVPYPDKTGEYKTDEVRAKILESLAHLKPIENPQLSLQLSGGSKHRILTLARTHNEKMTQCIQDQLKPRIIEVCAHQIGAWGSKDIVKGTDNLTELKDNVGALKAAHGLLAEDFPENMLSFTSPLDRFFNLNNENAPNILTEYAKKLAILKSINPEVTDAKDTWRIALQATIDEVHQLLVHQANRLQSTISSFVSKIEKTVLNSCFDIVVSKEEEKHLDTIEKTTQDIEKLNETLDVITKAITALTTQENVEDFTLPLDKFFYGKEDSVPINTLKTFMFFKILNPEISESFRWWTSMLDTSKIKVIESLEKKKAILANQQRLVEEAREREAREKQRLEAEERHRALEAEERARQQAEITRLAETVAQHQEQTRKDKEEARIAEAARIEAAELKAAEERQRYLNELARQQEILKAQQREMAVRIADEEAERQRAMAEAAVAQQTAAAQQAETARQVAVLQQQLNEQRAMIEQQEAERRRLAAAEAERLRLAQATEAERLRLEAIEAAKAAEIQRLLNQQRGTIISQAQYESIPAHQRGAYTVVIQLQKVLRPILTPTSRMALGASPPTYRKL